MRLLKFIKRPDGNDSYTLAAHFTDGKEVAGFTHRCQNFSDAKHFITDMREIFRTCKVRGEPIEKTRYSSDWNHYLDKKGVYKNLAADESYINLWREI